MSKTSNVVRGSHYLTPELVERAIALTAPMIEHARELRNIVGSGFLYIVVMDPALTPANSTFEEAVLHEHAFGDRADWDADYANFARAKARLCWWHGRDASCIQTESPHLLRAGDTLLAGGVWLDGLVVAASGAMAVYDEVFASTVALWLRALAREARAAETARLVLGEKT